MEQTTNPYISLKKAFFSTYNIARTNLELNYAR